MRPASHHEAGGAGRVLLGSHGGERRWLILLIETGLGALPGTGLRARAEPA
jgi:hypothetical protein